MSLSTLFAAALIMQTQATSAPVTLDEVLAKSEATAAALDTCSYTYQGSRPKTSQREASSWRGGISQHGDQLTAWLDEPMTVQNTGQRLISHNRLIAKPGVIICDREGTFVEEYRFPPDKISANAFGKKQTILRSPTYPVRAILTGDGRSTLSALRARMKGVHWELDTQTLNLDGKVIVREILDASNQPTNEWTLDARKGFIVVQQRVYNPQAKLVASVDIEYSAQPPAGFSVCVPMRIIEKSASNPRTFSFADWKHAGPDDAALEPQSLMSPTRPLALVTPDYDRIYAFILRDGKLVPKDAEGPAYPYEGAAPATTQPERSVATFSPPTQAASTRTPPPPRVNDGGAGLLSMVTTAANPVAWFAWISLVLLVAVVALVIAQRRNATS